MRKRPARVADRTATDFVDRGLLGEQVEDAAHLLAVAGGEVDQDEGRLQNGASSYMLMLIIYDSQRSTRQFVRS